MHKDGDGPVPPRVDLRQARKLSDNLGWTLGVFELEGVCYLDVPVASGHADGLYQFEVSREVAEAYVQCAKRRCALHAAIWRALQTWAGRMPNAPAGPVWRKIAQVARMSEAELDALIAQPEIGHLYDILSGRKS